MEQRSRCLCLVIQAFPCFSRHQIFTRLHSFSTWPACRKYMLTSLMQNNSIYSSSLNPITPFLHQIIDYVHLCKSDVTTLLVYIELDQSCDEFRECLAVPGDQVEGFHEANQCLQTVSCTLVFVSCCYQNCVKNRSFSLSQ